MEDNKKNNGKGYGYSLLSTAAAGPLALTFTGQAQAQQQTVAITEQPATPPAVANTAGDTLGFAAPWLLAGALALPLLWFLMRLTPPQPATVKFPGTRLLKDLAPKEETPQSLPWWHKMIRLGAAALVIGGLAGPLLNPDEPIKGTGPLMLVVDNGWAAARNWDARQAEIERLIARAEYEGRGIMILATAPPKDGSPVRLTGTLSPAEARDVVKLLEPQPWPVDRAAALAAIEAQNVQGPASVVWLSNGLDGAGTMNLAQRLQAFGSLVVQQDAPQDTARLLVPPSMVNGAMTVTVRRPPGGETDIVAVIASDRSARAIDRREVTFAPGQTEAQIIFDLPAEIQNQMVRIDIEGENTAGATVLLDGQWRHRPVGLVTGAAPDSLQPLLSEFRYIETALSSYADLRRGAVDDLLRRELAVMVIADGAALDEAARQKIDEWVRGGGTVLRFAGPRLAQAEDSLLPVDLRDGGVRSLGGAMSWSQPAKIAPFDVNSPFHGLQLPPDVVIERQVLAEPGPDLDQRTWARLEDGTPLVTAERRGEGLVVLVHTSANTQWSNLVLSGLFMDMLRVVIDESAGVHGTPDGDATLAPWKTMDAEGKLESPSAAVRGLSAEAIRAGMLGPQNPPGIYGDEAARRAYNLGSAVTALPALPAMPAGVTTTTYVEGGQSDMTGPLLGGALGLILADLLIVLGSRRFRGLRQQQQAQVAPAARSPA